MVLQRQNWDIPINHHPKDEEDFHSSRGSDLQEVRSGSIDVLHKKGVGLDDTGEVQ